MASREELQKKLLEIQETQNERQEKYYSWLKTIITISVGLFGIIVSFKSDDQTSQLRSIFFIISISTLGLGILFGLTSLYSEVHLLDRSRKKLIEQTHKLIDGNADSIEFEFIKPSIFYKISYRLCYMFYIISLISLIGYAIIDDINNVCLNNFN
ncbi:hypothetical protein [Flagellimonas marina]|uniref:DUF4231 domain-containing protein n=1 Tax=Flagellimonas marina TaxID=1775168 RepID=A0ABV8PH15_9FLAO